MIYPHTIDHLEYPVSELDIAGPFCVCPSVFAQSLGAVCLSHAGWMQLQRLPHCREPARASAALTKNCYEHRYLTSRFCSFS